MTTNGTPTITWPASLVGALGVVALAGAGAFVVGVLGEHPQRAWQIYLVNYVFWTGVAVAGVVLAGIWKVTNSIWGKAFQGLAVAGAGFFPAALVLFLPLTLAGEKLFPWIHHTKEHRALWMNPTFVFARDALSLLALFVLAGVFVYYRVRPLVGAGWRDWQGLEAEHARSEHMCSRLAPVLFIVYALVLSLLAFDLIMPLDPHWVSTLFGGYYFFGSLYAGLAWLAVLAVLLYRSGPAQGLLAPTLLHPVGKLLFGFCMFHGMLFYSQFLPIWYGNLPEEIEFVIVRMDEWPRLSLAFLLASLLLPFIILISRPVKKNPRGLAMAALIVLVGMWLDKYVLVVPSLWHEHQVPFGLIEVAITAGFAALLLLSYYAFSRRFPLIHYHPSEITPHH